MTPIDAIFDADARDIAASAAGAHDMRRDAAPMHTRRRATRLRRAYRRSAAAYGFCLAARTGRPCGRAAMPLRIFSSRHIRRKCLRSSAVYFRCHAKRRIGKHASSFMGAGAPVAEITTTPHVAQTTYAMPGKIIRQCREIIDARHDDIYLMISPSDAGPLHFAIAQVRTGIEARRCHGRRTVGHSCLPGQPARAAWPPLAGSSARRRQRLRRVAMRRRRLLPVGQYQQAARMRAAWLSRQGRHARASRA